MLHKNAIGSIFAHVAVVLSLAGFMYSGVYAQTLEQINTNSKKSAAKVKQSPEKTSVASSVSDSGNKAQTPSSKENHTIVVYYFHGNARCPTCFKLESFAKSEVEADFADAIKNGSLAWKTVNVEDKGNEHYSTDYNLYSKSVVISIRQNGKEASWKNLDRIWQLVHEEPKYREYIKTEVAACLKGKCL